MSKKNHRLQQPQKKTRRRYYTPKVIDIDLDNGEMPLVEFCKAKAPDNTTEKYLVIAAWLKQYRSIENISSGHIYTCYKKMGWGVQRDMAQPLRDAKSNGYFASGNRGEYKINHIGEDKVRKMNSAG